MFKTITKIAGQAKAATKNAYGQTIVAMGSMMMATEALAQADPTQPLQQVEDARTAARDSTIDVDSFETGASNVTDTIIFLGVPLGIGVALWGVYDIWKQTKDENARRGPGTGIIAICAGAAMTVVAVVTSVPTEYFLGTN